MQRQLTYRYFFMSFATAFFILSVLFLFLMITVHPGNTPAAETTGPREVSSLYAPTAGEAVSVLFIGSRERGSDAGSFILARFDPAGGKIPLVVFPPQTMVQNAGGTEPLSAVYAYGGADYTRNALSRTLGLTIDRYVRMDTSTFISCAGAIGNVEFDLPCDIPLEGAGKNVVLSQGRQLLDGQKAAGIISFREYEGGELARCRITGELAAAIVNQRIDVVKSTLVDKIFEKIINLIDTDISYLDYDNRREAALYLAEVDSPAASLPVSGSFNGDGTLFTLSDTFIVLLTREFTQS